MMIQAGVARGDMVVSARPASPYAQCGGVLSLHVAAAPAGPMRFLAAEFTWVRCQRRLWRAGATSRYCGFSREATIVTPLM